eukprot:5995187-Ditylum_brightwellii.AAC.1
MLFADLLHCTSTGIFDDDELKESFLKNPTLQVMPNPIPIMNIQQHQFMTQELNQQWQQDPANFPAHFINGR